MKWDKTVEFLRTIRARGPWTLTAIVPDVDGAPTTTFCGENEIPQLVRWIEERNGKAGIYFSPNPTKKRRHARPTESDMAAFQFAHVDIDPLSSESAVECRNRAREALAALSCQPTLIWDSGNGVQALWKLRKAVMLSGADDIEKCKAVIRSGRILINMSQSTLGDALHLTFQQVQKYEKGTNRVGSSRLQAIANALGREVAWFFEGVPEPANSKSRIATDDPCHKLGTTRDGVALARAFNSITNPKTRQAILAIAEAAAA